MYQFWDKYFDKVLIAALFVYVFTFWVVYGVAEVRDISRDLIIAIVALASGRRNSASTEITTDTVQTDTVNTDTMPDATVHTKALNVKEKK